MPLLRLIAEGVGPFERLDLDFSDGHGNPHLGPHILAGVNGSGKSTALRAVAWTLHRGGLGFHLDEWKHFLDGHPQSRALVDLTGPDRRLYSFGCSKGVPSEKKTRLGEAKHRLREWMNQDGALSRLADQQTIMLDEDPGWVWTPGGGDRPPLRNWATLAAYAPSRALRYLGFLEGVQKLTDPYKNCLAFESTVDNEGIHRWLLDLYSRRAIAKERGEPTEPYERSLGHFQAALGLVCGEGISYDVDIERGLQLRLRAFGQSLNFSQLPDGVRNTVGWLADFMMRQDLVEWAAALKGKRPGILLLDEVDAHLHPRWQRTLLPAMRAALPDVQIIVTSHSPFIISSCPGARVHVLKLDERSGRAQALKPEDVPVGQSVVATLKDIFGVSSRFDVQTERELEEWNQLLRQEAAGKLSRRDRLRLDTLTTELSQRNEELRYTVAVRQPPGRNSTSIPSKRRQRKAG